MVLHGLGGLWVALAFVWVLAMRDAPVRAPVVLAAVLLVGVSWELFEVAVGMPREANYALDTVIDLGMDLFGGVVGIFFIHRFRNIRAESAREARAQIVTKQ